MLTQDLLERSHYEKDHECKTPDALYTIEISGDTVSVSVQLPFELDVTKDDSEKLEADLHYAVEKLLAPFFKDR